MSFMRYRKYLPHLESQNSTYFVTFRLADSIPKTLIESWKSERIEIVQEANRQGRLLSKYEKERLNYLFSNKIQAHLDNSYGQCWLRRSEIAQLVIDAFKYFDGKRYHLHAWCVMPNHVHVVFTVISKGGKIDSDLIPILHSWKSYTAHEANKILQKQGIFWEGEYYDRLIRSDEEFAHYIDYTLANPIKASLCEEWEQWP